MAARTRGSQRRRVVALGLAAALAAAAVAAAGLLLAPLQRSMRVLGPSAIGARMELGLALGRLLGRRTVLLVGDSRIEALPPLPVRAGGARIVLNAGVPGSTAATWAERLAAPAQLGRYDVAVLWAGINDFLHADAPAEATSEQLARGAARLLGHARRVWVIEQPPVRLSSQARSRELGERVKVLNARVHTRLRGTPGVAVLPLHDALLGDDGLLAPWCSDDGLHLNVAGNDWLLQRLGAVL